MACGIEYDGSDHQEGEAGLSSHPHVLHGEVAGVGLVEDVEAVFGLDVPEEGVSVDAGQEGDALLDHLLFHGDGSIAVPDVDD